MTAPVLAWQDDAGIARVALVMCSGLPFVGARVFWAWGWLCAVGAPATEEPGVVDVTSPVIAADVPRSDVVPDAVLLAAEAWLREHVQGIAWPAGEEQLAPQREPVAGWEKDKDDPLGVIIESWALSLGPIEAVCIRGAQDIWHWTVRESAFCNRRPYSAHGGGFIDLRTAMLAAEDAAAERERARVEVLGYRMVRK